eukprot:gene7507-562_t
MEVAVLSRSISSADGKGISINVWNYTNGICAQGTIVAFKQCLVAAQADKGAIFFWKWDQEKPFIKIPILEHITALTCTHDVQFCIAGSVQGTLFVWQISSGKLLAQVPIAHYRKIVQCHITSDSNFMISAGDDGIVRVWSLASLLNLSPTSNNQSVRLQTKRPLHTLHKHSLPITSVILSKALSSSTRIFTGGRDRNCHIWELATGELLTSMLFEDEITAMAVDTAETELYVALSSGVVHRVNLHDMGLERSTGLSLTKSEQKISAHSAEITTMAITTDGLHLITCAVDGMLRVWDTTSLQAMRTVSSKALFISECKYTTLLPSSQQMFQRGTAAETLPVRVFERNLSSIYKIPTKADDIDSLPTFLSTMDKVQCRKSLTLPLNPQWKHFWHIGLQIAKHGKRKQTRNDKMHDTKESTGDVYQTSMLADTQTKNECNSASLGQNPNSHSESSMASLLLQKAKRDTEAVHPSKRGKSVQKITPQEAMDSMLTLAKTGIMKRRYSTINNEGITDDIPVDAPGSRSKLHALINVNVASTLEVGKQVSLDHPASDTGRKLNYVL